MHSEDSDTMQTSIDLEQMSASLITIDMQMCSKQVICCPAEGP